MATVAVYVPEEIKKSMAQIDIEWNEYLRGAIIKKIKMERREQTIEKLRKVQQRNSGIPFDTTRIIRDERDRR